MIGGDGMVGRSKALAGIKSTSGIVTVEAAVYLGAVTAVILAGFVALRDDTDAILCNTVKKVKEYAGYDVTATICGVSDTTDTTTDSPPETAGEGQDGGGLRFTEYADTVDFTSVSTPMPFPAPQFSLGGNDFVTLPSSQAAALSYGFASLSFDGGAGTDSVVITSNSMSEVWTLSNVEVADVAPTTNDLGQAVALNSSISSLTIGDLERVDLSQNSVTTSLYATLPSALADFGTAQATSDTTSNYLHLYRSSAAGAGTLRLFTSSGNLKLITENVPSLGIMATAGQDVTVFFHENTSQVSATRWGVYGDAAKTLPLAVTKSRGYQSVKLMLPDTNTSQSSYLDIVSPNITVVGRNLRFSSVASGTRIEPSSGSQVIIEDGVDRIYGTGERGVVSIGRSSLYDIGGDLWQLYIDTQNLDTVLTFTLASDAGSDGIVTFSTSTSVGGAYPSTFNLGSALGTVDLIQEDVANGTCTAAFKSKSLWADRFSGLFAVCYNSGVGLNPSSSSNVPRMVYEMEVPPSAPRSATTGLPSANPVILNLNAAISKELAIAGEAIVLSTSSNNGDGQKNLISVEQPATGAAYGTSVLVKMDTSSSIGSIVEFEPGADFFTQNGYNSSIKACTTFAIQLPSGTTYDALFGGGVVQLDVGAAHITAASKNIQFGTNTLTGTELNILGSRVMIHGWTATLLDGSAGFYSAPPRSCFLDG